MLCFHPNLGKDIQIAIRDDEQGGGGSDRGEMGEFMEMDKEDDGSAIGRFLRIKIRLDIRKPLMRGVMIQTERKDGEVHPLWCPVVYEFLPDFCYTCGLIGHIDRVCTKKLQKDEVQQYSKALRFIPERRRLEDGGGDRNAIFKPSWRQSGSGSRGSWGSGGRSLQRGSGGDRYTTGHGGSDAPSWRNVVALKGGASGGDKGREEEEEVTSPLKMPGEHPVYEEKSKKTLFPAKDGEEDEHLGVVGQVKQRPPLHPGQGSGTEVCEKEAVVNSAMHVDGEVRQVSQDETKAVDAGKEKGGRGGKYKKLARDRARGEAESITILSGSKRATQEGGRVIVARRG